MSRSCCVLIAVVLLTAAACAPPPAPPATPAPAAAPQIDPVQRGAYLVDSIGCDDCHTPGAMYGAEDRSRRLSGSDLGWAGPWGVSYSSNLTPGATAGVSSWSAGEFVTAMRTGTRPNGTPMLPPMPWPRYATLVDDDLRAIHAFLRSLPAISHEVPANLPPGAAAQGPVVETPPPPAWDAPR